MNKYLIIKHWLKKYLSLDYWMNKLGYRRTHWTDEMANLLFWQFEFSKEHNVETAREYEGYKVTLSVKKMKK